jgi:uroporphyrinogen-III synthase
MPLNGLHIMITRPAHQADSLRAKLTQLGAKVTLFPTLEIRPTFENQVLQENLDPIFQKESIDFLVFISANAVWPVAPYLKKISIPPILAIGPGTEAALLNAKLSIQSRPLKEFNVEGLLKLPELQNVKDKTILLFSGVETKLFLEQELSKRGAWVRKLEVYRRTCPKVDVSAQLPLWQETIDVIVSTSSESLNNLFQIVGSKGQKWLRQKPLLIISKTMQEKAVALKLGKPKLRADNATDEGIINALLKWRNNEKS